MSSSPSSVLHILKKLYSCAASFLIIMFIVALRVLEETKPMWYYTLAASLFIASQLVWFLLGRVICNVCTIPFFTCPNLSSFLQGSNHKMDGSWIATGLETGSMLALFLGWRSITEGLFTPSSLPTKLFLNSPSPSFIQIHGLTINLSMDNSG